MYIMLNRGGAKIRRVNANSPLGPYYTPQTQPSFLPKGPLPTQSWLDLLRSRMRRRTRHVSAARFLSNNNEGLVIMEERNQ